MLLISEKEVKQAALDLQIELNQVLNSYRSKLMYNPKDVSFKVVFDGWDITTLVWYTPSKIKLVKDVL